MVKVKRYDYVAQFGDDIDDVVAAVRELMLTGRYGTEDDVAAFEREFSAYLGAGYATGVNTGTDALVIALSTLGIGRGDEVITQANTFNATVAAICLTGATPVLVDARERTFLIDEAQLEVAITRRTRAIIPVHLYGKPVPMDGVLQLSRPHGIAVVEDAAQAHGARISGVIVGTLGTVGCFSFHPSKNLAAAGDGGAVVTDDPELDSEIKRRRALGQRRQNDHVVVSPNSRLHAVQAVVLRAKLPKLDAWNRRRREAATRYREVLTDLPLEFQETSADEEHVYHLFQIRTTYRDRLLNHLQARGVDAVVRYPVPIHLQPAFADQGWRHGQFPIAERLADELLCLPIRPDLTDGEIEHVGETVRTFFGSA